MSVALASTWRPHGERPRWERLHRQIESAYLGLVVALPPEASSADEINILERQGVTTIVEPGWESGRHLALRRALELPASHIHYCDFDRLLRWVETRPEEWERTVAAVEHSDCLIIGRTAQAYQTHPQALIQTEKISNAVVSHLLGRKLDLLAGSRGFSRRAAQFLLAHSPAGRAVGTDAEWPVLLHRAGFELDYVEVDGLDWETADRYQLRAADREAQHRAAETYDRDARHWARRVELAREVIQAGLEAFAQVDRPG